MTDKFEKFATKKQEFGGINTSWIPHHPLTKEAVPQTTHMEGFRGKHECCTVVFGERLLGSPRVEDCPWYYDPLVSTSHFITVLPPSLHVPK